MVKKLLLAFAALLLLAATPAEALPTIDGSGAHNIVASNFTVNSTITTTQTNDIIIVYVVASNGPVSTVFGDTLTYTLRRSFSLGGGTYIEEWYAKAASALTGEHITVNAGSGYIVFNAFAVNGANFTTPFDSNGSLPSAGATGTTVSTTNANDMIIGGFYTGGATTAGSGFTMITNPAEGLMTEYKIVSSTQAGLTVDSTDAVAPVMADALMSAGGGGGSAPAILSNVFN